jgi:hypothetical protein
MALASQNDPIDKKVEQVKALSDICDTSEYECERYHLADTGTNGITVRATPCKFTTMLVRHFGFIIFTVKGDSVVLQWDDAENDTYLFEIHE